MSPLPCTASGVVLGMHARVGSIYTSKFKHVKNSYQLRVTNRASQIEVGVVGQVHNGGRVRGGGVGDQQLILLSQLVLDHGGESAGITLLAVRRNV